jgi:hypothetical protein
MHPDQLSEIKNNPVVRKRLAKLLASQCFRNSMLEDFHAGTVPSSQSGDYSDVIGHPTWRNQMARPFTDQRQRNEGAHD